MSKLFSILFAVVFCVSPAIAGIAVWYCPGYGLYPYGAANVTSTVPGTGLLANNGSGRTLIQLIYAGFDHVVGDGSDNRVNPANAANGYVTGDDWVMASTVLSRGMQGVDEWGFSSTLRPPHVDLDWNLTGFAYVRVFHDDTPQDGEAYYDTPLVSLDLGFFDPTSFAFAQWIFIDPAPVSGVALNRYIGSGPAPTPQIPSILYLPGDQRLSLGVPGGYRLNRVLGATGLLGNGGWDWQPLAEGADYENQSGTVSIFTAGAGAAPQRVIRIGVLPDP